jgi:hypothetical protein
MRYTYSPLSGPVADMTREIPFEMLFNYSRFFYPYSRSIIHCVLHNPDLEHGVSTYMKGLRITKRHFEVVESSD